MYFRTILTLTLQRGEEAPGRTGHCCGVFLWGNACAVGVQRQSSVQRQLTTSGGRKEPVNGYCCRQEEAMSVKYKISTNRPIPSPLVNKLHSSVVGTFVAIFSLRPFLSVLVVSAHMPPLSCSIDRMLDRIHCCCSAASPQNPCRIRSMQNRQNPGGLL